MFSSDPQHLQQLLQISATLQGNGGLGNRFGTGPRESPAPGTPGDDTASPTATDNPIPPFNMLACPATRPSAVAGAGAGAFLMDPPMQQLLGMKGMSGLAGAAHAQPPLPIDTSLLEVRVEMQLQLFLGVTYFLRWSPILL